MNNSEIEKKVLDKGKSSKEMLAEHEDELFEVFKKKSDRVRHTATGKSMIDSLPDFSMVLSLDLEDCKRYFVPNNTYVSRTIDMK